MEDPHHIVTIPLPNDPAIITAMFAGLGILVTAVVRAMMYMRASMHEAVAPVIAEQTEQRARGVIRDEKIEDIHVLVNSRLLVVAQLLVGTLRKEAERTHDPKDVEAYRTAVDQLELLEQAARRLTERKLQGENE